MLIWLCITSKSQFSFSRNSYRFQRVQIAIFFLQSSRHQSSLENLVENRRDLEVLVLRKNRKHKSSRKLKLWVLAGNHGRAAKSSLVWCLKPYLSGTTVSHNRNILIKRLTLENRDCKLQKEKLWSKIGLFYKRILRRISRFQKLTQEN